RLEALEAELFEKARVAGDGEAPFGIVIALVERVAARPGATEGVGLGHGIGFSKDWVTIAAGQVLTIPFDAIFAAGGQEYRSSLSMGGVDDPHNLEFSGRFGAGSSGAGAIGLSRLSRRHVRATAGHDADPRYAR